MSSFGGTCPLNWLVNSALRSPGRLRRPWLRSLKWFATENCQRSGFLKQEDVPLDGFLQTATGSAYASNG